MAGDLVKTVRVFVNGKPALKAPVNARKRRLTLEVPLFAGANRITAVAYDDRGFSSNPRHVDVVSRARGLRKPNLYVLAVGVSDYPELPGRWQLDFAHTDAAALVKTLQEQDGKVFGNVFHHTLANRQATSKAIAEALDALAAMDANDMAVIFMAGHGVRAADGTFHFLTPEGGLENPRKGSLQWASLQGRLSGIKGRVIMFLDACRSGSIVTETIVPNDELARKFFTGGSGGVMVFSASKGRQDSLESPDIGGGFGIFTYALTQALGAKSRDADRDGNGFVEFTELVDYVTRYVDEETEGQQTPWLSRKELFGDLAVAAVN